MAAIINFESFGGVAQEDHADQILIGGVSVTMGH